MTGLLVVTPPGPDSDVLCASLRDRGFEVHTAENGAAAVERALRKQPAVILMDPALSAMDRWHAVKRLNNDVQTSRIPVLTLASDATSPAGLQRVLTKIEQTLGRAQGAVNLRASTSPPPVRAPRPKSSETPPVQPPRRSHGSPPPASVRLTPATPSVQRTRKATPRSQSGAGKILVVDDNALNRDMLSRRLIRRGYRVESAEDGVKALERLSVESFDLVLLDWMMPGLSGIDVLRRIRGEYSRVELPVIMATAKTEADDVVEALRAEANDYVTKPLNFDVVNARIKTQLGLVEAHKELAASERRYRALLENTGDMIVQYEPEGKILYVSPACRTLLGYEPEAFQEKSLYDWIHPIDRRELESQRRARATLPPAFTFIARMQRQDQSYIWVETSSRTVRDEHGVVLQAACRDVTEHMERLVEDEPPLPLGGDIMAHPGWRGGASQPPAPARRDAPVAPSGSGGESTRAAARTAAARPTPVVLLTLLDGEDVARGSAEEIARLLGAQLKATLEGQDG